VLVAVEYRPECLPLLSLEVEWSGARGSGLEHRFEVQELVLRDVTDD